VGNPLRMLRILGAPGYTTIMGASHVVYLAHHWILLAVPAFLPAVIVVGVVVYVALRDRRSAGGRDASNSGTDTTRPTKTSD
jgi:hypothetical protein